MIIKVFSRRQAEIIKIQFRPHIWISITGVNRPPAKLDKNPDMFGVLRLTFDDVENPAESHAFEQSQAKEIMDFVRSHQDKVEVICIHCEAGMCRSAGVAAALSIWLNGKEDYESDNPRFPNTLVKSMMMRLLWEKEGE